MSYRLWLHLSLGIRMKGTSLRRKSVEGGFSLEYYSDAAFNCLYFNQIPHDYPG
jgi:hypothetical protein